MTKASLAAVSLLAAIAACGSACGEAPTTPSPAPPAVQPAAPEPPPPPPPAPTPVPAPPPAPPSPPIPPQEIQRLSLSGNLALTSVGETSQLTVTANLRDGTTRDVTGGCKWGSSHPSTATIGLTGLVTATGFGASEIWCVYSQHPAVKTLTATPPGTFAIGGRVGEPDNSDFFRYPLANAAVVDTASGQRATTDSAGRFSMGALRGPPVRLAITKDGFEPSEEDVFSPLPELPLQRIIRLTAGETVAPWLVEGHYDVIYVVADRTCSPCRRIRVVVPEAGTIGVRVTWNVPATLTLFVEGQVVTGTNEATAEVRVNEPREVVMYVGGASPNAVTRYTPFTFATSVR